MSRPIASKAPAGLAVALVAALAGGPRAGGQEASPRARVRSGATLEDSLRRAVLRAKKESDAAVARATAAPNDSQLVVIVEFADGDTGLFTGGLEEHNDQFVLLDAHNVDLVAEALIRAHSRSH